MDKDKLIYVGQKAFIERDGKILVLKDPYIDGVDFPGGKIQEGEENLAESLRREVREETKLEIEIGDLFYAWTFKFKNTDPARKNNEVFLVGYKCKYKSGEIELSDEHSEYFWVDKQNFRQLNDGSPHFKALEKYFSTS